MRTDAGDGFDDVVEAILAGAIAPADAPSEAAWIEAWESLGLHPASPVATAAAGGARADRGAWVFLAGYQAGLQRCFPEAMGAGIAAYAISEDREGALPGVSVEREAEGVRLRGTKTWLAACDHVRTIIVTVGGGPERRFYLVNRDAAGVRIEARPAPGFLGELSQGRVTFDGTGVPSSRIIDEWTRASEFAVAEPLHVLTALNACMLSQLRQVDAPAHLLGGPLATLEALRATAAFELSSDRVALALVGIEAATRASAAASEDALREENPEFLARWNRDARLLGMFTAGVRRRADSVTLRRWGAARG